MRKIRLEPTFAAWQAQARRLLQGDTPPHDVHWEEIGTDDALSLFEEEKLPEGGGDFRVSRKFVVLAEAIA